MAKSNPRTQAETVAHGLHRLLGERLHAVLLYGSAAREEYLESRSDLNVLVLLDRIDPALLQRMAPAATDWSAQRVNAMLLAEHEWRRASDAFAVELLDMQDARILLHGTDPVNGIHVDLHAARLQAERELRGRIIGLHNGLVQCGREPALLGRMLMAALPSFATYLRTALRLAEKPVPPNTRDVIAQGTELVGAPAQGWLRTLDARAQDGEWAVDITDEVIEQYNAAAERTASFVDSLGGGGN